MKNISVLEWNINQRSGVGKGEIPYWIKDEIEAADADIVVLTEFCTQCYERIKFVNDLKRLGYHCVASENSVGNDMLIGVKSPLEILCCYWFPCQGVTRDEKYDDIPENLSVDIDCDGTTLTVIGLRIKAFNRDTYRFKEIMSKKREEFISILNSAKYIENPVLITGDFNNHRRGYDNENSYNIAAIDKILKETYPGYVRNTPDGASWAEDSDNQDDHCFALDHFITKGISIKEGTMMYDRSFVYRDAQTYKWGTNFQEPWHLNADLDKLPHVNPPFPDHAILKGTFVLE